MLDLFHVVAGDETDDIVEWLEMLERVLARHHLAEKAAHDRERDDGGGDGHDDQTRARAHKHLG